MANKSLWGILVVLLFTVGCKKDEEELVPSPPADANGVNLLLDQLPYETLSEYRFFEGDMANQLPNEGVVLYDIKSHLFTDYALKNRYIYLPQGQKASYAGDHVVLDFPIGSVIIKNFYYNQVQPSNERRIIETRLLIRMESGWEFAEYVWNEEQSEAFLDMDGGFTEVTWVDDMGISRSTNYRLPSDAECLTCHKINELASPIGPKPQNLNMDLSFDGAMKNQLQEWMDRGYLESNIPETINTVVNYEDVNENLIDRVRAYVDINCAHCHQEDSHCAYRPMRFAFSETTDLVNLGLCIEPNELIEPQHVYIVTPGIAEKSVMHYRLNTTLEQYRMPLLGRTIVHEEGAALIEEWINSLDIVCE